MNKHLKPGKLYKTSHRIAISDSNQYIPIHILEKDTIVLYVKQNYCQKTLQQYSTHTFLFGKIEINIYYAGSLEEAFELL